MKFKKIITIMLLFLSFSILLTSCKKEDKVKLRYEKTSFINYSKDYSLSATSINTYFVDDSEIRYVDATNFIKALKGFYRTEYLKVSSTYFSDNLSVYCYVNTGTEIKKTSITFDWINDTITLSNSLFYNLINTSQTTNYSRLIKQTIADKVEDSPVVFELSKFNYNIYYKNGKCLVPFTVMNSIICSTDYYNIYYNGENYFGVTFDIGQYSKADAKYLRTCKLNNQQQTPELREECYNHLKFVMNYFYGLKEYKNISDWDEVLNDYKEGILSLDPEINKETYYNFMVKYFDELHTRMGSYSFYYDPEVNAKDDNWDLSKSSQARIRYKEVENQLKQYSSPYYDNGNTYRISGNTAIIYIDSFVTGDTDKIEGEEAYKYDTYEFVKYALDNISNYNVSNVVLDLSLNGGGNLGALFRTLGFLSNDSISYYNYDYLFDSSVNIAMDIDINNDGNYDDDDAYTQYNWYVLSSYSSFSAANSFIALSKSLGATIIGQNSGGGMCSVAPFVLPDGTSIEISSESAQMAYLDGEFRFIEGGIEPDIYLDYEKFYDIDYIDSILA